MSIILLFIIKISYLSLIIYSKIFLSIIKKGKKTMNYPYANENNHNPFLNQQGFDIVSFNSDNYNYLNEIYSLGMEKNFNIYWTRFYF